jgi:hypothetical protein
MSASRDTAVALGWTTLALTGVIKPVLGPGKHLALYHWDGSVAALFGPVLLVFLLVWAAVTALLLSARGSGRWRAAVWGAIVFLLPWLLVNALDQFTAPMPWVRAVMFGLGVLALAAVVAAWRPGWEPRLALTRERTSNLLLLLAFSGSLCVVQLAWFWWTARDLNGSPRVARAAVVAPRLTGSANHGRVVWIIFDELSYSQLFEHRFPGLDLPAFDRLAAQSVTWTHVEPAGTKTDLVLPSLIMGRPVEGIRASSAGDLLYREAKSKPWERFSQHDTVFQDARNAGYRTGVAGWYNPYCRLMPAVLDQCFWRMFTELDNGLGSDEGFRANVGHLIAAVWAGGLHDPAMTGSDLETDAHSMGAEGHLDDYRQIREHAQGLLADPSANFVLLHLPIPHPGGIFDRRTGQFVLGHTSYIDNLALSDRCLAEFRAQMEREGEWDNATVVVMGDHSWRTNFMWRQTPAQWTPEDEAASKGGQFDPRPAYLVKLPGETSGMRIDAPFAAVKTRQLLDGLLAQQLHTPDDVARWVGQSKAGH